MGMHGKDEGVSSLFGDTVHHILSSTIFQCYCHTESQVCIEYGKEEGLLNFPAFEWNTLRISLLLKCLANSYCIAAQFDLIVYSPQVPLSGSSDRVQFRCQPSVIKDKTQMQPDGKPDGIILISDVR